MVRKKQTPINKKTSRLPDTPESLIEGAIVGHLRLHHIKVVKIVNEGKRSPWAGEKLKLQGMTAGMPDLQIFLPQEIVFIEVKNEHGIIKPEQTNCHRWLRALGFKVLVWRSVDDAIEFVKHNKDKILTAHIAIKNLENNK